MSKGSQVRTMFDQLAPRYDLMNRVMTLGQDMRWRRFVVDKAHLNNGDRVLDLASGTGDIAFEVKSRYPDSRVFAADFSLGMLHQGKRRKGGDSLVWVACDAQHLPFEDHSFDAVTFGYLLRNVESIPVALKEINRVLKPGGRVVCLDTMPPPAGLMAPFVRLYLKYGLPILGRLIAGDTGSYTYLSDSTLGFQEPKALARLFEEAGFQATHWRTYMFQTIAVHWATC